MARDVVNSWENVIYQGWYEYEENGNHFVTDYPTGCCLAIGSRADIVKSDHFKPTTYWGHRTFQPTSDFLIFGPWSTELQYMYWKGGYARRRRVYGGKMGLPNSSLHKEAQVGSYFDYSLEAAARNKCLSRITESDVNFGQFFGELPSTLNMIADRAISVLQALKSVRRGQYIRAAKHLGVSVPKSLKGAKGVPKDVSNAWLEYKFGWLPMMSDIYNAHSSLVEAFNSPKFRLIRKRAVVTSNRFDVSHPSDMHFLSPGPLKGCEVGVTYEIKSSVLHGLNSLGLMNPAATAWELVPLSFVFDWFIPVGAFLSGLTAGLGLTFRSGYVTRFARGSVTVEWRPDSWTGYNGKFPAIDVNIKGMDRKALTSWPIPLLYINTRFSASKASTLLALIAQRT